MNRANKRQRVKVILLAGILMSGACISPVVAQDSQEWEYKFEHFQAPLTKKGAEFLQKWSNKFGEKGWEIVGSQRDGNQVMLEFKRRK